MSGDPALFKVLGILHLVVWSIFSIDYSREFIRLRRNRWRKPPPFAAALLTLTWSIVVLGVSSTLFAFLGTGYTGRYWVRALASLTILGAGITFVFVLRRAKMRARLR